MQTKRKNTILITSSFVISTYIKSKYEWYMTIPVYFIDNGTILSKLRIYTKSLRIQAQQQHNRLWPTEIPLRIPLPNLHETLRICVLPRGNCSFVHCIFLRRCGQLLRIYLSSSLLAMPCLVLQVTMIRLLNFGSPPVMVYFHMFLWLFVDSH